jgi:hypothetical protein
LCWALLTVSATDADRDTAWRSGTWASTSTRSSRRTSSRRSSRRRSPTTLGYAIFFGTQKGKNEFHRVYQSAKTDPAWTVIFKTIDDSLQDETGETIENLRQALEDDRELVCKGLMTEDEFNQEWYCSLSARHIKLPLRPCARFRVRTPPSRTARSTIRSRTITTTGTTQ